MTHKYYILEQVIAFAGSYFIALYKSKEAAKKDFTTSNSMYDSDFIDEVEIKNIKDFESIISRIHQLDKNNKYKFNYTYSKNKFELIVKSKKIKNFYVSSFISENDLLIKAINQISKYRF